MSESESSNSNSKPATASSTPSGTTSAGAATTTKSKLPAAFDDGLQYQAGFGNAFESECLPGALPVGRSNPRNVPYHLYTEQLSGTAFTAPRRENRRTWLYRIQPSVTTGLSLAQPCALSSSSSSSSTSKQSSLKQHNQESSHYPTHFGGVAPAQCRTEINPLRWNPLPDAVDNTDTDVDNADADMDADVDTDSQKKDFISGMHLVCQAGDPAMKSGLAIYMYGCQTSMNKKRRGSGSAGGQNHETTDPTESDTQTQTETETHFCNHDGEFLIVPEQGRLEIVTEVGILTVGPTEIAVVPRGLVFQVNLMLVPADDKSSSPATTPSPATGYVLEVYNGTGFQLPELGPIGSNGLANARDFMHPVAWCVTDKQSYRQACTIVTKSSSQLFTQISDHSPYNVVAWHGNYLPYKYDLTRFCAVGSVTYDHLDPSIYTVLTCPTDQVGTAMADFVIFPPRVMATDNNTLRPPWFHRNTMSEFMGLIEGQYDAKKGFVAGGASLHNCMTPHGPDEKSYTKAVEDLCENPVQFNGGLAFMFETCLPLAVAPAALDDGRWRDMQYAACWNGLADDFSGWHLLAEAAARKDE
jgi:homogentisate 1,2-dioxygenase